MSKWAIMQDADPQNAKESPPPPRYQPLVIVLAATAVGILCNRHVPLPLAAWWTAAAASLAGWAFCYFRFKTNTATVVGNLFLLLAIVATAGAWHHCRWNLFGDDDLGRFARQKAQPACVEAVAVESPKILPAAPYDPMQGAPSREGSRMAVDVVALRNGSAWQPASGRATLLILGEMPAIEVGDRLRCFASLSAPPRPMNPGERDRAATLRSERICAMLVAKKPQCVSVVETGSNWSLSRQLERLRQHGHRVFSECLGRRQAELAAAVLLNFREELDADRNEAFLTTGTIHILSISGMHVGVLAAVLFWFSRRLPIARGASLLTVTAVTMLYALMVDIGPPVVRATMLVLTACTAVWFNRRHFGANSLAAAALVVLALNPCHLFHLGAQLSFLCIAGLMWGGARWLPCDQAQETLDSLIEQNMSRPRRAMRRIGQYTLISMKLGIVLWCLCLPLIMARFHLFSPIALVLSTILWLPMSISLTSGFGVLALGAIFPPAAHCCDWLCNFAFWITEQCIDVAHRMPGSHFWTPGPNDWWLMVFYGGLALLIAAPRLRPPRRWCVAILAGWILVGFVAATWRHDSRRLDCTILNVGHGAAVFVEFPSGQTLLYDAGHLGAPASATRAISEFLWDRGLRRIDAVAISHADIDHFNALPGILEKISVGAVYVSSVMFEKDNPAVVALRKAIERAGVPIREVRAGDRLRVGDDCLAEALYPPRNAIFNPNNSNTNSLVLRLEYAGRGILLPGDLESPGLDDMLTEEPRRSEVLLAPHHGSRASNLPGLAKWCRPNWVIFSGGGRWNTDETEKAYQAVGGRTLHTFSSGAIRVQFDAAGIRVTPFLQSIP